MDGYLDLPAQRGPLVPANPEAEQAVLGSLLIDPDALLRIAGWLKPDDFYQEKNGWIYQAFLSLSERREAADSLTLTDELDRRRQLDEVGGVAYVMDLLNAVPTAVHVEHYARIVERTSVLRRIIRAAGQVTQLAYEDSEDIAKTIATAEGIMFSALRRDSNRGLKPISHTLQGTIDRIETISKQGLPPGILTGYKGLDEIVGSFRKGELIVLAARPSIGKSAFALNLAYKAAQQGKNVAIFSLEMATEQIEHRLLASVSRIDAKRIRDGDIQTDDDWHLLMESAGTLSSMNISIDDTPSLTMAELRHAALYEQAYRGLEILIIDYLQLMQGDTKTESRVQEISAISRGLKGLARELNIPVLALSQLSRALESRQDKRPMLSDLKESGAIEQDSDVVIFLYREDKYVPDSDRQNVVDVLVSKQRTGPTGIASLYFNDTIQHFSDLQLMERVPLEYTGASHAAYAMQES